MPTLRRLAVGLVLAAGIVVFADGRVRAQAITPTTLTYQGQLQSGAALVDGSVDLQFRLFTLDSGGTQVGSTITRSAVAVTGGRFQVNLDFGSGFDGSVRYIESPCARPRAVPARSTRSRPGRP